jgi:hypothetical protein
VVEAVSQPGGFSPGSADRVRLADGRRAFVKAVGASLNSFSPGAHRREINTLRRLPPGVPVARLLASVDDGDWVALATEEIPGRHPHEPWHQREIEAVLDLLAELAHRLTPAPGGFPTLWEDLSVELSSWTGLRAQPPDDLSEWAREHLDRLVEIEATQPALLAGSTLLHVDVRADNLLILDAPSPRAVLVDWPWAAVGAAWIDTAAFAINVGLLGGADPEDVLRGNAVGAAADPQHVTAFLVGVAGYFTAESRRPPPPGLPTVRAFQRAQGDVVLDWLARRGL